MADYTFFDKRAGDVAGQNEELQALFIGVPDVVRLPANLGGKTVKVVRAFRAACPVTKVVCRHLELEGGLYVAESDKFYWYEKK